MSRQYLYITASGKSFYTHHKELDVSVVYSPQHPFTDTLVGVFTDEEELKREIGMLQYAGLRFII